MRSSSKSARARQRLLAGGALLALTVALHAAVLAWAQGSLGPTAVRAIGERAPIRAIQVSQGARTVANQAASLAAATVSTATPDPPDASPTAGQTLPTPPPEPADEMADEAAVAPEDVATEAPPSTTGPALAAEPDLPPPPEPDPAVPATTAAGEVGEPADGTVTASLLQDYHPGRELTRRPLLITPITLDLPIPDFRPDPTATLRMRLLIGIDGRVDHVLVETSTLDPLARDAAIARFTSARYAPGEILGEAVRSQVLIEVGYSGR